MVDFAAIIPHLPVGRDELLERAVASVEAQTYQAVGLSVGTDSQLEGAAAIRNRLVGFASAASEWLAFLDDDDYWHPTKLEQVAARVQEVSNDTVMICHNWFWADGRLGRSPLFAPGPEMMALKGIVGSSSNLVVRRDAFEKVGGFDKKKVLGHEVDLVKRLYAAGYQLSYINEPLAFIDNGDHPRVSNGGVF